MGKQLVLIGGGHAHMVTLARLGEFVAKGHGVTVIGPSDHHYYSGMGPGMLGQTYTPSQIRFATRKVVEKQGGRFLLDRVEGVDPERQILELASGKTISYDVASFNVGSYVPRDIIVNGNEGVYGVKPIERLMAAQKHLLKTTAESSIQIAIIGGGPSAVEIAGNIRQLVDRNGGLPPSIKIYAGGGLLTEFPERIRRMAHRRLISRGIDILDNGYAKKIRHNQIETSDGQTHPADMVFLALGVRPSEVFKKSGLPTGPDGALVVNQHLQCVTYPTLFGGGDCIHYEPQPLNKVGVYAVRQNPILFNNLMASLEEQELQPFDPGGSYLLIFNLGGGYGLFHKAGITFGGKLAFLIKDWIARRFMEKFQATEANG